MNASNTKSLCTLCSGPVVQGPLLNFYLGNAELLAFVGKRHAAWSPGKPICANCLEHLKKEYDQLFSGASLDSERSGEKTVVTVHESKPKKVAIKLEAPSLLVIHGNNFGKKYDITQKELVIGRSDKADIVLNEENVSRHHTKIMMRGQDVVLEDLESTNGTFVNTKKVPMAILKDGDLILVGSTILKFISGQNVEGHYHQEIYKLATTDGLTQVFNKAYLLERLSEEFGRARRYNRPLSLILFDFDHFKDLNDQHGHQAGDLVLKQSCAVLTKVLRKEDTIGRYGGEEFAILFPETPIDMVMKLAEKFRQLVANEIYVYEGKTIKTTVSMGVATTSPQLKEYQALLKLADEALYESKRAGRNRVSRAAKT